MAQPYTLSDGSVITDNGEDLSIQQPNGQICIIRQDKVYDASNTPLTVAQAREFYNRMLHGEFFISADKIIYKAEIKQNTEDKFRVLVSAGSQSSSTEVELRQETGNTTISHNSVDLISTNHGGKTKTHKIHALLNATDREYIDYKSEKISDHGEKFENENSLSLKRNIKGKGQRLLLSRESVFFEDEGFITQDSNQTNIEISADEIIKTSASNNDKYRQKLKISYDLKKGHIQCRLKRTDFEAITIVEYKQTLLTTVTGKKYRDTTLVDRDFDGQLDIRADGSFTYIQEQTGEKGVLEKFKTQDDFGKVPADIAREVEQIKTIAGKIAVLRNSQAQSRHIDFAKNPSIFDEEIKFSEVKDTEALKLADSLSRGNAQTNRKLLIAATQTTDNLVLTNFKESTQRS